MFPFIPLLGWASLVGGAGSLLWYSRLSGDDKAKADRIAEEFATDLFDKAKWQLSPSEAAHIRNLTKHHFEN